MRRYHEIDRILVGQRASVLPISYSRSLAVRRPWVENMWASPMSGVRIDQSVVTQRP
jgi:hypothetical protein